ncbi:MAG: flagellar export protein FliJ [Terriglobia bacterium]
MAFRFPLQALLKLRLGYEERERLRLAAVISRLHRLRSQYESWQKQKQMAEVKLSEQMRAGMVAVEFHFAQASLEAEDRRLKLVLAEIAKVEQLRQAQQAAYVEAQKKRKILERLRERQAEAYRLVEDRREQQRQDELFAIRQSGTQG